MKLVWVLRIFVQNFGFYVEIKGAKNPHVLIVFNCVCGCRWRFLIAVLDLYLDIPKFILVVGISVQNFEFLC